MVTEITSCRITTVDSCTCY